jgi:hypothetical protein
MNKYVILSSIVAALTTWLFMYIDARLFDTPKTKFTYFKGMAFVSALVACIVYFMAPTTIQVQAGGAIPTPGNVFGVGGGVGGGGCSAAAATGDMLTGLPPF